MVSCGYYFSYSKYQAEYDNDNNLIIFQLKANNHSCI